MRAHPERSGECAHVYSIFPVKLMCYIFYHTSLILNHSMPNINIQARWHTFSIDRMNLPGISHASCHAVV